MAREKRRLTAEDLYRMQLVSDPQISPDGRHIIFCVKHVDEKTEANISNLWLVPTDRGRAYQFTYGAQKDTHPRWSPDGSQIAFISDRGDKEDSQIYLIPFGGGEARPLTKMKGTFGEFEWSPDGKHIVCVFRKKDAEALERESDEQKKKLGVVSRRINSADYKLDGMGYLPKEKWHIWTVNCSSGKANQLTEGKVHSEQSPRWSPDGTELLFLSNRCERPDIDTHLVDLFTMSVSGGEFQKIPTPAGPKLHASFSPDGKWIAFLCREGKGNAWQNVNLWQVPADGSAAAENLTGRYDIQIDSGTLSDTGDRSVLSPAWSLDGQRLYFQVSRHGDVNFCSLTSKGEDLQTIIQGGVVGNFSFDRAHEKLAYFHGRIDDLGQVWIRDMKTERSRKLTRINESWLRWIDLGQVEEVWYQGKDGNHLQGWILKPPDFDERKQYSSIMEIHGGPWLQYGNAFMHEFYFLAAHDYVVYFTNPRGGKGYGEAHSKAIHRKWGEADYADVMAWADVIAEKPYTDPERMGITGGSYGGYLTGWTIGHTDRFKAAVVQRMVSNFISFWGSSDIGYFFEDAISKDGEPPWADLESYWDQSPMKFVGNVKTPTLVIHSEEDMRCRLEQGEQMFLALREMGVETELVLFPDSPHGLSRSGRTDRRIARLNHILRWFEKYLK
jgi:dipeptidyl aminopeptidase/acylaminoacyl peptidase